MAYITNFEAHSVAMLATLVLGGAAAIHARPARADETHMSPQPQYAQYVGITTRSGNVAFQRADANHDGKLSRQEAERLPAIAEVFQKFDNNQDGFLTPDEFEKALQQ